VDIAMDNENLFQMYIIFVPEGIVPWVKFPKCQDDIPLAGYIPMIFPFWMVDQPTS
jgi:hypothetical protein